MTEPESSARFTMRKNASDPYWTIFDAVTAAPAIVNDVPIIALEEDETEDMASLLNAQQIRAQTDI
ncbi:hypothetical protein [Agrobacterium bohemicum]|uniref:Uncharacterized protein n=1 Tax=Agrobacterium bohemicum TaxID=2052828 RepID=A0A135P7A9_9HYPH|nr:hypothetical protein [Agrobacterium bohemicum]KXG87317.1 hypothetical protein ATO67_20140 [Agrobacterium bohemicum]